MVIGTGQSGTDIAIELVPHAAHVTLIGNGPTPGIDEKIERLDDWVDEVTEDGIVTKKGTHCDAEVIILATGYKFNFPFIPSDLLDLDPSRTG